MSKKWCVFIYLFLFQFQLYAQSDSLNRKRLNTVIVGESILYSGSVVALASAWYKNQKSSSFHFYNDNADWLQMDKAGHAVTSFFIGSLGVDALKWSGVERKKAIWYGGALGLVYLTSIEVMDGFSQGYGASYGDFISNAFGSALVIGQELCFNDRPVILKYSFNRSGYSHYRPELLGSSLSEELLKDYNGQTYWLSTGLHRVVPSSKIPKWLNIAFGYGAEGMIGGSANPVANDDGVLLPDFKRYRQYYLSLDVDLMKIKTKSKALKTVFRALNFIKIPFPTIEYSTKKGWRARGIYF